jgi:sortase A
VSTRATRPDDTLVDLPGLDGRAASNGHPAPEGSGVKAPPGALPAPGRAAARDGILVARPTSSTRGETLVIAGRIVTAVGLGLLLFIAYLFGFSKLSEARSQAILTKQFQGLVASGVATAPGWAPPDGDPVAMFDIPAIGVSNLVAVQGTTPSLLTQGAGHFRTTPLPGHPGNSVFAGRRSTYGAPFGDLTGLQAGDTIDVATPQGQFTYTVVQTKRVAPGQPDVLGSFEGRNTLTLVTSDPSLSARGRIAVVAEMSGATLPASDLPTEGLSTSETGLAGDLSALGPLLVWGELLIAGIALAWALYLRWDHPRVVWLLTTPVIVALAFLTFHSMVRLLPGTL